MTALDPPARVGRLGSPAHHRWLEEQARRLFDFFQPACADPRGGFFALDVAGRPRAGTQRDLVQTARMVHCFALGHLLGRPGSRALVDHGMGFLVGRLRDHRHGGFRWIADDAGGDDDSKQAYGHAFVLLAAASARLAGHPDADRLLAEVTEVLETRFWSPADGLYLEEFDADWTERSAYRGANSNMHLTEALLNAHDATGAALHLERAVSVARRLIRDLTAANGWWLSEHYTADWRVDREYNRDDPYNMYRPYGSVIGHAPEWSRLLLGIRAAEREPDPWLVDAARRLFDQAVGAAWDDVAGGLAYTVDFEGGLLDRDHYQWPISEAIGAAAMLQAVTGDDAYERWYERLWDFAATHLIDREHGGWFYVLDAANRPKDIPGVVTGKPDLYHALQSCLVPLLTAGGGPAIGLRDRRFRATGADAV